MSIKRLSKLNGENKKALHQEFKECRDSIEYNINYDILYLKKINNSKI